MPSPLVPLPAAEGGAVADDGDDDEDNDFFLLGFLCLFFSGVFLAMLIMPDELPPSAAVMKLQHARMMAHFFFAGVAVLAFFVLWLPLPFLEGDEDVRMTMYLGNTVYTWRHA
jgi:hypothetical protein